jgi:hypothetical protein
MRKEAVVTKFKYYPGSCMAGLRDTTEALSQDSRYQGRDFNPGPLGRIPITWMMMMMIMIIIKQKKY